MIKERIAKIPAQMRTDKTHTAVFTANERPLGAKVTDDHTISKTLHAATALKQLTPNALRDE